MVLASLENVQDTRIREEKFDVHWAKDPRYNSSSTMIELDNEVTGIKWDSFKVHLQNRLPHLRPSLYPPARLPQLRPSLPHSSQSQT